MAAKNLVADTSGGLGCLGEGGRDVGRHEFRHITAVTGNLFGEV